MGQNEDLHNLSYQQEKEVSPLKNVNDDSVHNI